MRRTILPILCLLTSVTACSDPGTVETLVGSYVATTLTFTEGSNTTDQLEAGSSIEITLTASGTTSGTLFVPGGSEDGGDFEADLAGTWSLEGSVVTFDHEADTFIRDMPFSAQEGRLTGLATFPGGTVRVVLERK